MDAPRSVPSLFIRTWSAAALATLLLEACENAAKYAGFRRFEMGATLTGREAVPHPWLPTRKEFGGSSD